MVGGWVMRLRAYQAKAVADLVRRLGKRRRVVCVAPTGSGKTVIGAAVVKRLGVRTLWLAHRRELLAQAQRRIDASGVRGVTVASIDAMRRHAASGYDLIVIDEAHRVAAKSYQAVLASSPRAMVLGLTATPWRLDGTGLGETFAEMLVAAGPVRLTIDGHLARLSVFGVPKAKAKAMVTGVASSAGDYAAGALGQRLMRPKLMGNVVRECAKHAARLRTLVFAASREHGKALARRFAKVRPTRYLDGATSTADRDEILAWFAATPCATVVNVDVLSEGYDCEAVECVAVCRPTKSLTRWLQYVGRASRPGATGRAVILDHTGNAYRHGLPQIDREWSLDGSEKGDGEAPLKCCEECDAMIPSGAMTCPECGAEQQRDEREVAEERAELERVEATERERARVLAALERVASEAGYGSAWVTRCAEAYDSPHV